MTEKPGGVDDIAAMGERHVLVQQLERDREAEIVMDAVPARDLPQGRHDLGRHAGLDRPRRDLSAQQHIAGLVPVRTIGGIERKPLRARIRLTAEGERRAACHTASGVCFLRRVDGLTVQPCLELGPAPALRPIARQEAAQ